MDSHPDFDLVRELALVYVQARVNASTPASDYFALYNKAVAELSAVIGRKDDKR